MPITTLSGFVRDTFDEILEKRLSSYQRLFGEIPEDGVLGRMAEADAEMVHSLHAHIEHEAQGFMPIFAVGQRMLEWGGFLIGPMKSASVATGTWRGTGADGTPVDALTRLTLGAVEYEVVTGGIVAGGYVDLPIRALVAGLSGNAAAGAPLALVNPILGMDGDGAVLAPGLTGGAEDETPDAYRVRYLVRLREPPGGGNDTDYRVWSLEVAGITRAWVKRGPDGSGEIAILVMTDDSTANGIPVGDPAPAYSGDLLAVYQHIEALAPSPGVRTVVAPTAKVVDYVVHGLSPDTPEIRAAIEAELADLHRRRAEPGKPWRWSWGAEAVATAVGTEGFDSIEPAASVVCGPYEIAVKGVVSYVP